MERKRSKLWNFFSTISDNKAKCDLCLSTYSVKGGSITNLKKHLIVKHRPSYDSLFPAKPLLQSVSDEVLQPSVSQQLTNITDTEHDAGAGSSNASMELKHIPVKIQTDISRFMRRPVSITREKKINDLILNMIIKDLQPFSVVEDSGFKDLINYFEPNYKIPSRYLLSTNLLDAKFELAKANVKEELKNASHISLTTDAWTSRAATSFQTVTAHYILDNWELQSALLGCFECTDRHTAQYIKQELVKIVAEWEIQDKIFACVTDNAHNMKAGVRLTGWEHYPCVAHTLNLIVRAGLEEIQTTIIKKVKSIAEHFHRSPLATNKLKSIQEQFRPIQKPLKLKMDVITRWNSTYDMLERVCILQEPLEAALGILHNPVENLMENEWQALPEIIKMLKPFKQLTEEFSSEKKVTISKVLAATNSVKGILNNLRSTLKNEISNQLLNKLITELNSRFLKSSRHPILSIAALLDPRFKKLAFSDESCYEHAKDALKAQLENLPIKQLIAETDAEITSEPTVEEDSIWMEFDMMTSSDPSSSTPTSVSLTTMRQYIEEKTVNRQENPLKWWRAREILYPELANLAKKYLAVMSTSVPSERIFSKSGQILSDRRASLKPSKMEKILFLNINQRFLIK